jgi:DNA helicase-2/ATP-dependent DNA helicase PcrA
MDTGLNEAQREAVETLSGPLLVLAGAGTGKTRVVTYRIARLIRHGVRPDRILAVTFTNKAAREMQERAMALLGRKKRAAARPEISTFHSLCVRILRRHIDRLGYPKDFAIYDRAEQEGMARTVLREIQAPTALLRPSDLVSWISGWKSAGIRPADAIAQARTDREHLAASAYRRYQKALQTVGAVDFDDLLLCTEELFDRFPDVRQAEADRFDHILIDEYQDTNTVQYRIVRALALPHRNLAVVGDDDQSIYAWRGAQVEHILRFQHDWPDAKIVRLQINYRSTREILTWANRLIAFNRFRHPKELVSDRSGPPPRILQFPDEEEEAAGVVAEIQARLAHGARPRDIAILCRTNEQSRPFEQQLRKAKIPYVLVGGMSFFDRKEVRDLLAYWRLLVHPEDDQAVLRVLNRPPRGIGPATAEALLSASIQQRVPVWEVLRPERRPPGLPQAAVQGLNQFCQLIEEFRHRVQQGPLVETLREMLDRIDYHREIEHTYPDPNDQQSRWAAVEELINALSLYASRTDHPSLTEFLQELTLTGPDREEEDLLQRDAVVLMTLHSAKGLEFPEVYLVGMEEGLLPHKKSIGENEHAVEEERRLCYVGMTRAKDRLTLTLALSRRKWGKPRPTIPSRFLYEALGKADNPNYQAVKKGRRPVPRPAREQKKK